MYHADRAARGRYRVQRSMKSGVARFDAAALIVECRLFENTAIRSNHFQIDMARNGTPAGRPTPHFPP